MTALTSVLGSPSLLAESGKPSDLSREQGDNDYTKSGEGTDDTGLSDGKV